MGLYACPGESIHSKYQMEWFRDIIFDAAKKSGKAPVIVIRGWTQNKEFRDDLARQKKWMHAKAKTADGLTHFRSLINGGIRIEAEWMQGPCRIGTEKYDGFEGTGYAAAYQDATEPMTARIKLDAVMECTVSVRALKGGAHQDRALAVEINGKRLKTTHQGEGPAEGKYTWEEAGVVTLSAGVTEIKLLPVGKRHPCADVILLTPVAGAGLRFLDQRPATSDSRLAGVGTCGPPSPRLRRDRRVDRHESSRRCVLITRESLVASR